MLVRVCEEEGGAAQYCMSAGWPCLILLMLITSCCLGCNGAVEVGRGGSGRGTLINLPLHRPPHC